MFNKSVDSIIASFQKNITDLEAISTKAASRITTINESIVQLQTERNTVSDEAARAASIAKNIKGLING